MRVKIWSNLIILSIVIIVFSCDNTDEASIINAEDFYGDGSYYISLARLSSPEIRNDYCGSLQVFELRTQNSLKGLGTVTIYRDNSFLNFQYNLTSGAISEGWAVAMSLVWVGNSTDWDYGRDGPEGGWATVPNMNVLRFDNRPLNVLHQIPLEDWMLRGCFTIAVRLALDDLEDNRNAIKAFINHDEYLTYMWNEPFCLEECVDPGTQNVSYWENNPDVWTKGVTIGGVFYSEELAIQIMKGINTSNDMSDVLFEELVSAKLNVELGNTSYCIIDIIEAADTWMEENGPVGSGILSDHPAYDTGNSLVSQLESYNNGLMCADPAN